jgi:hypothetical protein
MLPFFEVDATVIAKAEVVNRTTDDNNANVISFFMAWFFFLSGDKCKVVVAYDVPSDPNCEHEEWRRTCRVFALRCRKKLAVTLLLGSARCNGAFDRMDIPVRTSQPDSIPV